MPQGNEGPGLSRQAGVAKEDSNAYGKTQPASKYSEADLDGILKLIRDAHQ